MTQWIPNIKDTETNKGTRSLLKEAEKTLGIKPISYYHDGIGTVSFETDRFIVVAKGYTHGYVVSAHKEVIEYAEKSGKTLLMFLKSNNAFYMFNPSEIKKKSEPNMKGTAEMLNFDIHLGKRYEKDKNHVQQNLNNEPVL